VLLGYNLGRILSYSLAGTLAGAAGGVLLLGGSLWPPIVLKVFASLMLIAMGAYLLGLPQLLLPMEKLGGRLWPRIQPVAHRFMPVKRPGQALAVGLVWGWLPCGLVYSALATAMSSGSPVSGTAMMLAFGVGTVPVMMLLGSFALAVRRTLQRQWVRGLSGGLIMAYGLHGLWTMRHFVAVH
jgi:sulfite exporter TauE/SafE